jgi:hypothetical protein
VIIKAMAITRCPYCHAIIDENDKYCNNCGTQLLFPEDDEVDEEIPGEKIIDADVEDKDYTIDGPPDGKKAAGIIDLEEDLGDELEEKTEELALDKLVEEEDEDEDVTEEVILVDEIEAAGAGGKGGPEGAEPNKDPTAELEGGAGDEGEKDEDGEEEDEEEDEEEPGVEKEAEQEEDAKEDEEEEEEDGGKTAEEELKELLEVEEEEEEETEELPPDAKGAEPVVEYITPDREREEPAAAPSASAHEPVAKPVTFDTSELDGIGRTVELRKDKIDEFLEVLAEKRAVPEPPPKTVREPSGTLPPWAGAMKGAPVFPDEDEFAEAGEDAVDEGTKPVEDEEVEIFPRRRGSDSTIGLPERVGQSPLPFEAAEAEEEEPPSLPPPSPRQEREAPRPVREPERRPFEAAEEAAEIEEAGPRPPFSFSAFFKSKAFDVLFVGLFWLVALWLAAHSLDTTLFAVLGSMSGPMLLLYAVFVFIYFFLFKFFLGETLGDRLFRERDEP